MRALSVNVEFYKKFCEDVFGKKFWPDISRTNDRFGGKLNQFQPIGINFD